MPRPLPRSAPSAPIAPSPKMPSVEPRMRCDSVHGQSPRFMRSASSATLRRGATIRASVNLGGVSDGILAADEGNELELRQALKQGTGELDAFADRDDDVGVFESIDKLVEVLRRGAVA